jgi:uncharacterized protein YidB (DUF937 family)
MERTYEGESRDGNLQGALEGAVRQLNEDLHEGGVGDALASWVVTKIAGQQGGIAGFHSVKVTITAKRSPEWTLS